MLSLRPLQRALDRIYRMDVSHEVDDFVRAMEPGDAERVRREVVLVRDEEPLEIAVQFDADVGRALRGESVEGLTRFDAWCLTLEGVSHFLLLAHRAANDRPVSQLELELQADVDKFVVALLDRVVFRSAGEALVESRRLRRALFETRRFLDPENTVRGRRYRLAHRLAARYAEGLERRYVREGKLGRLVEELRDWYRSGLSTKRAMAEAA